MAEYTVAHSIHETLSSITVDVVTLTGGMSKVDVINRADSGAADMFVRVGNDPADPTALGVDTRIVAPGMYVTFDVHQDGDGIVVKVIGEDNDYSVEGY